MDWKVFRLEKSCELHDRQQCRGAIYTLVVKSNRALTILCRVSVHAQFVTQLRSYISNVQLKRNFRG